MQIHEEQLLQKVEFHKISFQLPHNVQEEGVISKITAYYSPIYKKILFFLLCVITAGLLYLFARWELKVRIWFLFSSCNSTTATHVLVLSQDDVEVLIELKMKHFKGNEWKVLDYRLYQFKLDNGTFIPIETNFHQLTHIQIIQKYGQGVSDPNIIGEEYGYNDSTIPDKTIPQILVDEILSPFYLFQIFSVVLWSLEEYYSYAGVIFVTSAASVFVSLRETRKNFKKLRDMTSQNTIEFVKRGGQLIKINSKDIVPGDLIEIRDGQSIPCDCILLNGSCIINESMLTGESIPILKSGLPENTQVYDPDADSKSSTLFAGTKCLETRIPDKGQVKMFGIASQTGFQTIKGQLVRSILFPKPTTFSFYKDSLKFIAVLAIMAVLGFLLTIKDQLEEYHNGYLAPSQFVINSLDLITITVPPALPTCLSIGVSFALSRLVKKQIYCISPNRVNVAGKITIMCFDKTGTLTEDGLDLYGVRHVAYSQKKQKLCFNDLVVDMNEFKNIQDQNLYDDKQPIYSYTKLTPKGIVFEIMASCHGLAKVDNQLLGDPLEVKMFEATQYELDDINHIVYSKDNNHQIKILRRFEFSSTLQRMSVIVSVDNKIRAHVKGSPEKLRELCNPTSIPSSYHTILEFYSKLGFRVLACGSKILQNEVIRQQAECDLTFMGFLVMQNKLKKATKKVIETLQDACIRTVMITGDNVLTAISVARQCQIVQPNQRIFLGDIEEKFASGKNRIVWKDFEQSDNLLDPDNLSPQLDIQDDPDDDNQSSVLKEDGLTLEIVEQVDEFEQTQPRDKYKSTFKQTYKEEEKRLQLENLDHLIDDVDPWKTDGPFVIAISGKAFDLLYRQVDKNPKAKKVFGKMLERAQIFARMKPEQKALLIQLLKTISRKAMCGMCGDGANDCGALKAADVGVSLSEAEASIAAPFTSKVQDISCIVKLLREGRASLVTSFQCFKFMALYSMIEFCTVTLLYQVISNLSDYQFLFIDVFIIIPLAATMGQTKAYKTLTQFQPGSNLISFPVLMSTIGQTIIQVGFQCIVYYTLINQSWYVDAVTIHIDIGDADDHFAMEHCYENTTMFLYANFQYVFQCIAFSIGKPFRQPFYTNLYFTIWLTFIFLFNIYNLFLNKYPAELLYKIFKLFNEYESKENPELNSKITLNWLVTLFILMIINMICTMIYEKYAVPIVTRYYRAKKRLVVKRYRYPENPYLQ